MFNLEANIISNIMLLAVAALGVASFVPQIILLLKTRKSRDLSVGSWTQWVALYIIMLAYSVFFTSDIMLVVVYFIDLLLCLITIGLIFRYRNN